MIGTLKIPTGLARLDSGDISRQATEDKTRSIGAKL